MNLDNLTEIVKNNTVYFDKFVGNTFYYSIDVDNTTYEFPVPIDDIEGTTLYESDKALIFMRWIRKALVNKTFVRI